VIDTDQQANLSSMMLTRVFEKEPDVDELRGQVAGSERVSRFMETKIPYEKIQRQTIAQVMMEHRAKGYNPSGLLVQPNGEDRINPAIPSNLHLVCGDTGIMAMEPDLQMYSSGKVTQMSNPFKDVQDTLRDFITTIGVHLTQKRDRDAPRKTAVRVFIDTNPALSIFTQMALSAATKLIVPVNADDFSNSAVEQMFDQLYGFGIELEGNALAPWIQDQYSYKMKNYGLPVPPIHAIIHNRDVVFNDKAAKAFQSMHGKTADILYQKLRQAIDQDSCANSSDVVLADRMFNLRGAKSRMASARHLGVLISGTMRDMKSTGIISTAHGLPLWRMQRNKENVQTRPGTDYVMPGKAVMIHSMQDMIGLKPGEVDEQAEAAQMDQSDAAKVCLMQLLMDGNSMVCGPMPESYSDWVWNQEFEKTRVVLVKAKFPTTGKKVGAFQEFRDCPITQGCVNRIPTSEKGTGNATEPKANTLKTRKAMKARLEYQDGITIANDSANDTANDSE